MIKKKTSLTLSTLTVTAAVGLSLMPNDSMAQRGERGGNDRGKSSITSSRSSSPYYHTTSRDSRDRFDSRRDFGRDRDRFDRGPSRSDRILEARFVENVKKLDELAAKMVWRARIDSWRSRDRGSARVYQAVSRHAELTKDLVKAAHGSCPVALRKAALAVEDSVDTMAARRKARGLMPTGHRTCGTISIDPITALIRESQAPSTFVVQNLRNYNFGNDRALVAGPGRGRDIPRSPGFFTALIGKSGFGHGHNH